MGNSAVPQDRIGHWQLNAVMNAHQLMMGVTHSISLFATSCVLSRSSCSAEHQFLARRSAVSTCTLFGTTRFLQPQAGLCVIRRVTCGDTARCVHSGL
jgi:hypothetical protein